MFNAIEIKHDLVDNVLIMVNRAGGVQEVDDIARVRTENVGQHSLQVDNQMFVINFAIETMVHIEEQNGDNIAVVRQK